MSAAYRLEDLSSPLDYGRRWSGRRLWHELIECTPSSTGSKNLMQHIWVYDKESLFDFLGFMIVHAPEFPEEDFLEPEEQLNLDSAFEELKAGLAFIKASHADDTIRAMNKLVAQSHLCFSCGDEIQGTRYLQNLDDLVHPNKH